MKLLQDDRIILRALEPSDLDIIFNWENDTSIWNAGCNIAPFSKLQISEYIRNYSSDIYEQHQLRLIIEEKSTSQAIGMVDLFDFDPFSQRAYIGLLIDKKFSGNGYGKAATKLMLDYASDFLGMHQIIANIPVFNAPCLKIYKELGFEKNGVLKDWIKVGHEFYDVAVFQKIFN